MRVLSLNFGDANCASSQFRIHAYQDALAGLGIEMCPVPANEFTRWNEVGDYDAVILQKKLFRSGQVRALARSAKRLLYDIDDAIWEPHGRRHGWLTRLRTVWRVRAVARAANVCLAANGVLARYLSQWTDRARVFPMCLDEQQWKPAPSVSAGRLRIGWSGAPGNLPYLEALTPALLQIQERHPHIEWTVLCGKAPQDSAVKWTHVPWRPGCEAEVVPSFSIGLLPLPETAFAAAKSPIKGLQYMACGVPTVATPLEATRELFVDERSALFATTPNDWVQALDRLITHTEERQSRGRQSRETFESHYALGRQAAQFASYLRGP